jgi:hypothetical protein
MTHDSQDDPDVAALADRPRRTDPSEMYDDIDSLPEWWRKAIREFEARDLRPYRPARFADDELVHETVIDTEARFGVDITIIAINPRHGDDWTLRVDSEEVARLARRREPDGYTIYELTREEFVDLVESAV